jgi:hypothetical protein
MARQRTGGLVLRQLGRHHDLQVFHLRGPPAAGPGATVARM